MAGQAVSIAILANARDAVAGLQDTADAAGRMGSDLQQAGRQASAGLDQVARAVNDTETRLDAAGRASGAWADRADFAGGAAAKFAGGLGDVADGLAANGVISEEAAEKVDQVAKGFMVVAGAADIFTTAAALSTAAQNAGGLAAARNAAAQVASRTATLASAAATKVAAAAQWLFNAAMAANPLGLIIIAVVALVAAIVLLWKNSETFRKIVIGAWTAVKTAAVAVFDFLKRYFTAIWETIKGIFSTAIDAIQAYFGFIFSLPGRLLQLGKDIMRGLADGIKAGLDWVKDKIKGIASFIPDWLKKVLGIRSASKVMRGIGRDTMAGYVAGLQDQLPALRNTMTAVASAVTASPFTTLATTTTAARAAAITARPTTAASMYAITINVGPAADPAEAGRHVVAAIEAHERRTGRRRLVAAT